MGKKKTKKSNTEANIIALMMLFVLVGGIALFIAMNPVPPEVREQINREKAEAKAKAEATWRGNLDVEGAAYIAVEKFLVAPSTVKYRGLPKIREEEDGVVVVTGAIDSQNTYGAMLRQNWRVEIEPLKRGREWRPNFLLVQIGDQTMHTGERETQPKLAMPHEQPRAESVLVASLPSPNRYRITFRDFASLTNPHGEGAIVSVPQKTRFNDVERKLAWFVIEGKAYNLNGAAASLTPNLPWPRDADPSVWARTGLDSTGSQALRLAFP